MICHSICFTNVCIERKRLKPSSSKTLEFQEQHGSLQLIFAYDDALCSASSYAHVNRHTDNAGVQYTSSPDLLTMEAKELHQQLLCWYLIQAGHEMQVSVYLVCCSMALDQNTH